MPDSAATRADRLEGELRAIGEPDRAAGAKRYLKSDLAFLGASVGDVRRAIRSFDGLSRRELLALVRALWSRPVHERRLAAVLLLERHVADLAAADLDLVVRLVRESGTWAYVDVLAGAVAGPLVVSHPEAAVRIDAWAADEEMWVRRAALLAQLAPLRAGAPLTRFGAYADAMLEEREFFIRKAIGWVLRETGKQRPEEVFEWLLPRVSRASGVTLREAVKYLPAPQRERLLSS